MLKRSDTLMILAFVGFVLGVSWLLIADALEWEFFAGFCTTLFAIILLGEALSSKD